MAKGESKVFAVMDATSGEIQKFVEAANVKEVRAHLLKGVTIDEPAALTVARGVAEGIKLEKAARHHVASGADWPVSQG